jgi:hypothetical protein
MKSSFENEAGLDILWRNCRHNGGMKKESGLVIERFANHTEWTFQKNISPGIPVSFLRRCLKEAGYSECKGENIASRLLN